MDDNRDRQRLIKSSKRNGRVNCGERLSVQDVKQLTSDYSRDGDYIVPKCFESVEAWYEYEE